MKKIKYSVLRYFPSKISGESINLGLLCAAEEDAYRRFIHHGNWRRLRSFDDEINLDFIKLLFRQIEEDLEDSLCSYENKFSIEKYIKNYTGDFAFDSVQILPYEDLSDIVHQLEGIYLKFDIEKEKRLTKNEEKKFIENIMDTSGLSFMKRVRVAGEMDDPVVYDYLIDEYGIKILNLDNKDINRMFSTVKAWAWNCDHAQGIKPIIIFNYNGDETSKQYAQVQTILRILESTSAQIYNLDEGVSFLQSISIS